MIEAVAVGDGELVDVAVGVPDAVRVGMLDPVAEWVMAGVPVADSLPDEEGDLEGEGETERAVLGVGIWVEEVVGVEAADPVAESEGAAVRKGEGGAGGEPLTSASVDAASLLLS